MTGQLRKTYAITLHDLAILMRRVHLVAYKVIKRGRGGAGHVRPAFTPALVDLQAMDVGNMTETTISEVAAGIGLWGDWQTLLPG